jgi:hypothetical protein
MPSTPHADKAAAELRSAMEKIYGALQPIVQSWARRMIRLRDAADVEDTMRGAAQFIRETETLGKETKLQVETARAALAACMLDIGSPPIEVEAFTVSLVASTPSAIITDEKLLPSDVWTKPKPDRQEIGKRLRAGEHIPGAILSNTGPPHLSFRSKS